MRLYPSDYANTKSSILNVSTRDCVLWHIVVFGNSFWNRNLLANSWQNS